MSVRGVLAVAARGPGGVDVPWNLRTRDLSKWCVHARARSAADPDLLPIGDGTYAHALGKHARVHHPSTRVPTRACTYVRACTTLSSDLPI